jgi:hypothetical protein
MNRFAHRASLGRELGVRGDWNVGPLSFASLWGPVGDTYNGLQPNVERLNGIGNAGFSTVKLMQWRIGFVGTELIVHIAIQ